MDKLPPLAELALLVVERRRQEGLTQKVLAELAGVSHPTVVNLEKGEGKGRLENAWAILETLGIAAQGGLVGIQRGKKRHVGSYRVADGMITVRTRSGSKTTQLGGSAGSPTALAMLLLGELVNEGKG